MGIRVGARSLPAHGTQQTRTSRAPTDAGHWEKDTTGVLVEIDILKYGTQKFFSKGGLGCKVYTYWNEQFSAAVLSFISQMFHSLVSQESTLSQHDMEKYEDVTSISTHLPESFQGW